MCDDGGVFLRLGRDGDFDLGVVGGELGESLLDEVAGERSFVSTFEDSNEDRG